MIVEAKNRVPFIDFGFGFTDKTVNAGDNFTVWVSGQFNENNFVYSLSTNGSPTITKVSNFEYIVSYASAGTYNITANLVAKDKRKSLISNTITINVI